jgi:ATP synthase protein I
VARKNEGGQWEGFVNAASLGLHLVSATFIGLAIGYYLDKWLCSIDGWCTRPWMTVFWLLCGIYAGFRDVLRMAKRLQKEQDERDRRKGLGSEPDTPKSDTKSDTKTKENARDTETD